MTDASRNLYASKLALNRQNAAAVFGESFCYKFLERVSWL